VVNCSSSGIRFSSANASLCVSVKPIMLAAIFFRGLGVELDAELGPCRRMSRSFLEGVDIATHVIDAMLTQ
jgi:hypothetical protein